MVPTSPEFFGFVLIVFAAYWLLWRSRAAGLAVILAANYFFYAKWGWIYLVLVPSASTVDFLIGRALGRSARPAVRRSLVTGSIVMNVGLIVICRYIPFLAGGRAPASWVLPLGLSFYAFQAMTYTIDIYRNDAKPVPSFLTYLCSVSFFPTTLAGPITRVTSLAAQLTKKNRVITGDEGGQAVFLICRGLAKKFLIADYLANNLITRVFDLPTLYSGGEVLVAVYAFTFQLYYDFSGYTDIVMGSAALLGLKLPANFNRPYMARNIADFWRRWHISLSDWLRDYLYFSLPGKRSKTFSYLNLVITMAIGGLWHGANWTFLIWGLLHGAGLAVYRGWQAIRNNPKPSSVLAYRVAAIFVTFHFVTFTWIFFRASSLDNALAVLSQIASLHFGFDNVSRPFWLVLTIAVLTHFTPKEWFEALRARFVESPALVQAALVAALVAAIQYTGSAKVAPFIYTKF
jgi:D-alanyl-lipoteichoic acid acyltransferase DltB (MBOAT superfamily)